MTRCLLLVLFLMLVVTAALRPASPAGARVSGLEIAWQCSHSGGVRVDFYWTGFNLLSLERWLDISLANSGWAPGSFRGSGPHASLISGVRWSDLASNTRYYIRVNELLPSGEWDASPTFVFDTPNCMLPVAQPASGSSARAPVTATSSTPAADSSCHSAYQGTDARRGGCIRADLGDYDCQGGTGDGPNFASRGTLVVRIGTDPYRLDDDNDGAACEPNEGR